MSVFAVVTNRRVLIGAAIVGVLLAIALWPRTAAVSGAAVARGPLVVTIDEEGQTRVRDRYVVAAPVNGRVLRVELEAGDPVKQGQVVATVRAEAPPLLDARTIAELQAAVSSAEAALSRARAEEQRARSALAQSERELRRVRELIANELGTAQELDAREAASRDARELANAATFAVRAAQSEVQRARVRLAPAAGPPGRAVDVLAPADGVVLKRIRESESVVPAGDPLLEIGDQARLEIVADLLSTDAVRVPKAARAIVDRWGGDRTLDARVRRIEPSGFTKISALGVEEQRVNVLLDFRDPASAWAALGDGYRVEIRIVIWESPSVLKVPTGALFRVGEQWAVYVIEGGRARQRPVSLGHQTGQDAEILEGVSEGARVIVHPGDTISDGVRVREGLE